MIPDSARKQRRPFNPEGRVEGLDALLRLAVLGEAMVEQLRSEPQASR
jgi:hypothetical protein